MEPRVREIVLRRVVFVCLCLCPALWAYSGGTGDPNDPYQIATAEDLIALGQASNDYNDCFVLTADIDLSGYTFERAVIAPDEKEGNSSYQGTEFGGAFDGQGHVISNLRIRGQWYLGLFGQCSSGARISNLGLEAVDVNGIRNYVGGLIGKNYGTIISSYSTGTVCGNIDVGGLVGRNYYIVTSSYSTGSVIGEWGVGGLIGHNYYGTVTSSYSMGSVIGEERVGGLVGYNYGTVTSSYSTGSVIGKKFVGGLVGYNYCTVTSSYSMGSVLGGDDVGGLVGYNYGTVTSSYSTGSVLGDDYVGGLVGDGNADNIALSFWDIETSGQSESSGGTGLNTVEMQDPNTFLAAGWDFVEETAHGTCNFWLVNERDYPCLAVFSGHTAFEPNGLGTQDDPYLLNDVNDLGMVWRRPWACYRVEADIDLGSIAWNDAVVPGFGGCFDGNGHVISNLTIKGGGCLGLFGICVPSTFIIYLGLDRVDVNGIDDKVGGLVGWNLGSITSSYSTGSVSGANFVGGLVGYNYGTVTSSYSTGSVLDANYVGGLVGLNYNPITSSYSTGSVLGDDYVGGLVGWNDGSITSSYSTGSVSGVFYVGGLVGRNSYTITSSYSTGSVSGVSYVGGLVGRNSYTVVSSFWDFETSGQTDSDGGTGLSTIQMQDVETFLDAGWDFVDETVNGSEDIWMMSVTEGYPRLWWAAVE